MLLDVEWARVETAGELATNKGDPDRELSGREEILECFADRESNKLDNQGSDVDTGLASAEELIQARDDSGEDKTNEPSTKGVGGDGRVVGAGY